MNQLPKTPRTRPAVFAACFALACGWQAALAASADDGQCLNFTQTGRLSPEDYRKATARLKVVEDYHFGPGPEFLIRPMQVGMTIGGDLDYTLWGYPNHHRALVTLVRLGAREKTDQPRGTQFSIDCYFRRALHIASDDLIVRMLYASYLGSLKRQEDAMRQLAFVVSSAGDNAFTHYNAGLVYLEIGASGEAVAQAKRARELGFEKPGLQEALQRQGKWPAEAASSAASASAASASSPGS